MTYTRLTKTFIGFMVLAAAGMMGDAMIQGQGQRWHPLLAMTLLLAAVGTSRMKVTIPGVNGSMSVNLPFLMLSVITLSATESILIACACAIMQTLPQDGGKLKPVRVLFNVSMMAFSSGAAGLLFHQHMLNGLKWVSAPLLLTAATATFFLGQTLPVSVIVALTDGGAVRRIWSNIAQMSFPYYVVSAGLTSMLNSASQHIGWLAAVLVLPVMYTIYRSYRLYFVPAMQAATRSMAMSAAAGMSK
ncbi:MAG TPA: hypothetical protein VNW47_13100 [Terriglobales bacterium]|jgi:hypothetical protein|nr:hypothetical protein [Terriglobales bacterium]